MRKYLILLLLGLMATVDVFGHASTITRSWCGGFFHRRFVARANTSVLWYETYNGGMNCIGQWVGYAPIAKWSSTCSNEDKGCARPRVATCNKSGTVTDLIWSGCFLQYGSSWGYTSYAQAQHLTSGIILTQNSSGRGSAGLEGDYIVDPEIASRLNDDGTSSGSLTGNIWVGTDKTLNVTDLTGRLSITDGADFFSKIKIIVIREPIGITDDEAERNEQAAINGKYPGVVYTSELNVTKGGVLYEGIFDEARSAFSEDTRDGSKEVNVSRLNLSKRLAVDLEPSEMLTVITVIDGGFDISSAIIGTAGKTSQAPAPVAALQEMKVFPNPASSSISVEISIEQDGTPVQVSAYDVTGRLVKVLHNGDMNRGTNTLQHLDMADLPRGLYFIRAEGTGVMQSKPVMLE